MIGTGGAISRRFLTFGSVLDVCFFFFFVFVYYGNHVMPHDIVDITRNIMLSAKGGHSLVDDIHRG